MSRRNGASPADASSVTVADVLALLGDAYASQLWHWMADAVAGPIDVIAGAVLVQHTTWRTAERALGALRDAGALDIDRLATMPEDEIASLVRIAGTPTVKAKRLRAIATTIRDAGGLEAFLRLPLASMRPLLQATHGIGPETADAIALYAAGLPSFVIDAYTTRLFRRIGIGPAGDSYDAWQRFFVEALPGADAADYQRYHAWIVLHGKAICRARPRCEACMLLDRCAYGRAPASDDEYGSVATTR